MRRSLAAAVLCMALAATSVSCLAQPLDPSLLRPRRADGIIAVHQRGAGEFDPPVLRDEDPDEASGDEGPGPRPGISARAPRGRAR